MRSRAAASCPRQAQAAGFFKPASVPARIGSTLSYVLPSHICVTGRREKFCCSPCGEEAPGLACLGWQGYA
jgi:hypothetical protein